MSRKLSQTVTGLFGPDVPLWAVELTPTHVVAVGAVSDRQAVSSSALIELRPGLLSGDVREPNIADSESLRGAMGEALERAGFSGSELALVIPDDAVRIAFLSVDSLPAAEAERYAIVRWKLKKTVPFDIESARVSCQQVGENGNVELLVAMARAEVADQYEVLAESLGLHAGIMYPSTLATLNLLGDSTGDVLFVKKSPVTFSTSIVMGGKLCFYRSVRTEDLNDAVYPVLMYYQDKLGGGGFSKAFVCGVSIPGPESEALGRRLGVGVRELYLPEIPDAYKPALGALQT